MFGSTKKVDDEGGERWSAWIDRTSTPTSSTITMHAPGVVSRMMQSRAIAALIGLDLNGAAFDVDMFRRGLDVELEHGRHDPQTNVTDDDPLITGKIAWAHLKELPDYYDRLEILERELTNG